MIEISLIGMKELNFQVFEFSRMIQQKQRTLALKKFQAKQIQLYVKIYYSSFLFYDEIAIYFIPRSVLKMQ